jgi:hypothetical protein
MFSKGFEFLSKGFEISSKGFEFFSKGFEILSKGFYFLSKGFEILSKGFEISAAGFAILFWLILECFSLSALSSYRLRPLSAAVRFLVMLSGVEALGFDFIGMGFKIALQIFVQGVAASKPLFSKTISFFSKSFTVF